MKYTPGKCVKSALNLSVALALACTQSGYAQDQPSAADVANARNHINKGNYLLTHQQFQGAIKEYEQALELDPMNNVAKANIVLVHNNWGIQYFHQRKYEEARSEWNESLKLSPSDRNAKNNLLVLKNTLAKMPPPQPKQQTAPGSTGGAAEASDADSSSGAKIADPVKPVGSQSAQEDNRGVVILSQPAPSAPISNTDAAAMSTSGPAIVSPPAKTEAPPTPQAPASNTSSSAGATRPNNSIYSNAINTNQAASESPFAANPIQSPPTKEAIYGTSNNDFKSNVNAAPSPAPTTSATSASTATSTFATAPVTNLGTLESTLGEIEIKVYGSPKKDLPILQRLEKLEQDTNSKVGSGGIADRIQALAKSYGI